MELDYKHGTPEYMKQLQNGELDPEFYPDPYECWTCGIMFDRMQRSFMECYDCRNGIKFKPGTQLKLDLK